MERFANFRASTNDEQRVKPENGSTSPLSLLQRELDAVVGALVLLGVKRCSQCGHFFRTDESGSFFDGGDLVCYACIPAWWSCRSPKLSTVDRAKVESRLASWLRKHHEAVVIKDPAKLPEAERRAIQLTTTCAECGGSGKLLEGERCRFCDGRGIVFVVVLKQGGSAAAA